MGARELFNTNTCSFKGAELKSLPSLFVISKLRNENLEFSDNFAIIGFHVQSSKTSLFIVIYLIFLVVLAVPGYWLVTSLIAFIALSMRGIVHVHVKKFSTD